MLDKPTMNRLPSVCRASRVALRLAEGAFLWVSLRSRQNVSRLRPRAFDTLVEWIHGDHAPLTSAGGSVHLRDPDGHALSLAPAS